MQVQAGNVLDDVIQALLIAHRVKASPREAQLIQAAARGLSDRETGESLGIAANTVNTYWRNIFEKFGCHTKIEVVANLFETSLASLERESAYLAGASAPVLVLDSEGMVVLINKGLIDLIWSGSSLARVTAGERFTSKLDRRYRTQEDLHDLVQRNISDEAPQSQTTIWLRTDLIVRVEYTRIDGARCHRWSFEDVTEAWRWERDYLAAMQSIAFASCILDNSYGVVKHDRAFEDMFDLKADRGKALWELSTPQTFPSALQRTVYRAARDRTRRLWRGSMGTAGQVFTAIVVPLLEFEHLALVVTPVDVKMPT